MFWRRDNIKVLPYLDDFIFMKHRFFAVRPVGAPDGGGLHPSRYKDQCAEVQCDPGSTTKIARLRRGLRGPCVPGPGGPVRRAEASGGLDYVRPAWKGSCLQVGNCHGDGAFHAPVPGSCDPVVFSAFVCLD